MTDTKRVRCHSCQGIIREVTLLTAPHPFCDGDVIMGCPQCKQCDGFLPLCDVETCEEASTCGWPSEQGYRFTCFEHSCYKE